MPNSWQAGRIIFFSQTISVKHSPSQEPSVLHNCHLLASLVVRPILKPKRCFSLELPLLECERSFRWSKPSPLTKETHCKSPAEQPTNSYKWRGEFFFGRIHQWVSGDELNKGFLPGKPESAEHPTFIAKCVHYAASVIAVLIAPLLCVLQFPTVLLLRVSLLGDGASRFHV